jgi:hypothetical protein
MRCFTTSSSKVGLPTLGCYAFCFRRLQRHTVLPHYKVKEWMCRVATALTAAQVYILHCLR